MTSFGEFAKRSKRVTPEQLDEHYAKATWTGEERIIDGLSRKIDVPELPKEIIESEPQWLLDARYALIGVGQLAMALAQETDEVVRDRFAAMVQGVAPFRFGIGDPSGGNVIVEIALTGGKKGLKEVLRNRDGSLPDFTTEDVEQANTPDQGNLWASIMSSLGPNTL